uniref:Protein YIPF n=1 Tax=Trichuris muris TaxID=70415 RepID=A0A5S6QZ57_TRIMR
MAEKPREVVLELGGTQVNMDALKLNEFAFLPSDPSLQCEEEITGEMQPKEGDRSGTMSGYSYSRNAAADFLEKRGFGWLLDTDNDDEVSAAPLLEELDIDVRDIFYKVRCVLLPLPYFRLNIQLVRDNPDFWGPLAVVLAYAMVSLYGQLQVVSWILTIWFVGSFVIFLLARSLGGEVNFPQCLGVIGYCLIPIVLTACALPLLKRSYFMSYSVKIFGILWAVYSAGTLLCSEELREKRLLLLYPIFLLYVYFFSLYTGV